MNGEAAASFACEVMYLAACLLTGKKYERITDPEPYRIAPIELKGIKKVRRLRTSVPLAYAYMIKAIQILHIY